MAQRKVALDSFMAAIWDRMGEHLRECIAMRYNTSRTDRVSATIESLAWSSSVE